MDVRFTHPRTSDTYLADVSPQLTAKGAVQALLSPDTGPFLPPLQPGEDYQLVHRRTNQAIAPDSTLESVGVNNGDVLDVLRGGQGANLRSINHIHQTKSK